LPEEIVWRQKEQLIRNGKRERAPPCVVVVVVVVVVVFFHLITGVSGLEILRIAFLFNSTCQVLAMDGETA
jgi:hypothetical protein